MNHVGRGEFIQTVTGPALVRTDVSLILLQTAKAWATDTNESRLVRVLLGTESRQTIKQEMAESLQCPAIGTEDLWTHKTAETLLLLPCGFDSSKHIEQKQGYN